MKKRRIKSIDVKIMLESSPNKNWMGEDEYWRERRAVADQIVGDVERHVDNVDSVRTHVQTEDVCSFCGYGWQDALDEGSPACCPAAMEEWAKGEQ